MEDSDDMTSNENANVIDTIDTVEAAFRILSKDTETCFPKLAIILGQLRTYRESGDYDAEEMFEALSWGVSDLILSFFGLALGIHNALDILTNKMIDTRIDLDKSESTVMSLIENVMYMQSQLDEVTKNLKFAGYDSYKDYLKSSHWKDVRKRALENAKYRCALCPSNLNLEVHHKNYNRLGGEWDEDVVVLCRRCHKALSVGLRMKKESKS